MLPESQDGDAHQQIRAAVSVQSPDLPQLLERHYDSLLQVARQICSREDRNNSLNPTALVHEVFLKLLDQPQATAQDTLFFRACFARQCRRVLVDHARQRRALRRGGSARDVTLTGSEALELGSPVSILEIDDVLARLQDLDPRMARIADLRLFAGMTIEECAKALAVSPRTVDKDWQFARSYLKRELR